MSVIIETNNLLETIESIRKEMIYIGIQEGLTSESTIKLSEKLDTYIAKYQKINDSV
jgi:hypothetical protein